MSLASSVVISPVVKEFPQHFQSQEKSLALQGMIRTPGTTKKLSPKMEATGLYRTGLDEQSLYIKGMSKEEKETELSIIKEIKERLNKAYPGIDLSSSSKVWDVWSNAPVKANSLNLGNENIYLNLETNPVDLLTYAWVRVHPGIAKSREAIDRGESPDCQYYIADESVEQIAKFKRKQEQNKAITNLEVLSKEPTKILKVAALMGLPVTDNTNVERAYNLIDDELKKGTFKTGEHAGRGIIGVFNEICSLADDKMNVRALIEKAIRHNIYRMEGDKVKEGSNTVSDSKADLVKHLMSSEGQKDFAALQIRVKAKDNI